MGKEEFTAIRFVHPPRSDESKWTGPRYWIGKKLLTLSLYLLRWRAGGMKFDISPTESGA